jgi:glycosyltransferase involved in cell wall biosynthesis
MAATHESSPSPKRVLFVENGIGYGGAIICLRHLVRNLDRSRYEPIVVTGRSDTPYQGIAAEAEWVPIRDRHVDVARIKRRLATAGWLKNAGPLRWLVYQVLARVDDFANFLPFFLALLWLALRRRPALIHVNNEPLCNRAAVFVGRLLGVPVIAHVRGDLHESRFIRWLYSLPAHFIPVSNWVSANIGRLGVPPGKRTPVYDGIELDMLDLDADGTAFRQRHGIAPDAFAVGLVGLLIPWKGQRLFLEAGRILLQRIPNLQLLLVGGTPDECVEYEAELRALAAQPEFAGRVVFAGHVGDMPAAYNGLDVVVSASTSPEPLGTVVIESLALARPLVAPDHGGAVEMVEQGRTGLLFRAGDARSLAEAILALHADAALGKRLGAAARQHALKTFAVGTHAARVQEIFDDVLAQAHRSPVPRHSA